VSIIVAISSSEGFWSMDAWTERATSSRDSTCCCPAAEAWNPTREGQRKRQRERESMREKKERKKERKRERERERERDGDVLGEEKGEGAK